MALTKVPSYTTLADGQFLQIAGPDGITTAYHFDEQQRALYFKESQVLTPTFHGHTHIAEDPVPNATTDLPGLMSANDKAKLDAMVGMRLGVLGFQGSGFPDDGGWMMGDIILAAGTEFITLERVGNVVRFVVDSPIPLNCACEECQQIFWIQDETDLLAIRPPTCGGKLPGANTYGELKVYLFPASTIADPNNVSATLQNKGNYPTLFFRRYTAGLVPGLGEFGAILKRNANNLTQTEIGWSFTPGAAGVPEVVWFTGRDDDGTQTRFDMKMEPEPGLLGAILYNGHLLTKKMGVIVDYTSAILATNQYTVRLWDVDNHKAIGTAFAAKNVWQYLNPENGSTGSHPQSQLVDSTIDLLPQGTLVDMWAFKVGEVSGEPILRWYFSKRPSLNPQHLWSWIGQVQFGDDVIARDELPPTDGSEDAVSAVQLSAVRDFERRSWGLTGYDDPLISFDTVSTAGTEFGDLTVQHRATIDTTLPGLTVMASEDAPVNFSERPVWLWNRHNLANAILRVDMGRPDSSNFTPYDVVIRAPIDEHSEKFMQVIGHGDVNGVGYVRVCGVHFHDLPPFGTLRILAGDNRNLLFNYHKKLMFPTLISEHTNPTYVDSNTTCESIVLAGSAADNLPYPGAVGDIVELLHQEYSCPIVRLEFSFNEDTQLIEVQFKVGNLDMSSKYESDIDDADDGGDIDDYVRGMEAGYAVSAVYSQQGTYTGVGTQPDASPEGFVCYDGGTQVGGDKSEYWNRLEVMVRDDQVWIWWNQLLIPPSATLSAALPTPVNVETPYFPLTVDPNRQFGKYGLRMWPGASVRRLDLRSQASQFSEFTYGQLEVG